MATLKTILLNLLSGANIVAIALMLASGYSDRLSPASFPLAGLAGMLFPFTAAANLLFIPVWVLLSWRRLLIPVVGFLLTFPPIRIYMPLNMHEDPPEGAIRIVSYNVCGYGGNFKYDQGFDTVFNYLKALQPDIVCLQEDDTKKKKESETRQRLAEYFAYNDTTNLSNSSSIRNCLGIHTRFPILRKEIIGYDSPTNGSVAYFLQVGTDTIIVINNHLEQSHLSTDDRNRYTEIIEGDIQRDTIQAETVSLMNKLTEGMKIRASHVEVIHQYIEDHKQYPIISCGDFNDTPISYTRHIMSKGLTDCFVETGRGLGISFNRRGFNFRIDHMMCSSHFQPYACEIDNKMDASDHYPLLCWLKMSDK